MDIPRHWRSQRARQSLVGARCADCGNTHFPPRVVCSKCGSPELAPIGLSGSGALYSFATVYQAPEGFGDFVPYTVALVRLDEGPLVATQLTDLENVTIEIGMSVEMVTRRLGEDGPRGIALYGYKFRPVLAAQSD